MNGMQSATLNACMQALLSAYYHVMDSTPAVLLADSSIGKSDTRGLDAIPEINIKKVIADFDPTAILVTEETDQQNHGLWPDSSDPRKQPTVFFSDPTDRSKYLEKLLRKLSEGKPDAKLVDLFKEADVKKIWEEIGGSSSPSVTGATTSLSCISKGEIIFSVIINYVTAEVTIACDAGVRQMRLPDNYQSTGLTWQQVCTKGKELKFPPITNEADRMRFVTYIGKKSGYEENFIDSRIVTDYNGLLYDREPGGPARIFFLSNLHNREEAIGFILANGEKIAEWMPWLAFVKFSRHLGKGALKAYEIWTARPMFKDDVMMSTPLSYSFFLNGGDNVMNVNRLRPPLDKASHFRSMIAVAPADNAKIISIMENLNYREITSCL